ncbi:MAG: serine/threonine-protein kinase [Planctomycetota bacterium]
MFQSRPKTARSDDQPGSIPARSDSTVCPDGTSTDGPQDGTAAAATVHYPGEPTAHDGVTLNPLALGVSAEWLSANGAVLDDFRLVKVIGRGGMGIVYEARQVSLDRSVAVKLISSGEEVDEVAVKRFKLESHALAILKHPNIVPIHCIGSTGGVHYFVMDLIQGENLAKVSKALAKRASVPGGETRENTSATSSRSLERLLARWSDLRQRDSNAFYREICALMIGACDGIHHAHQSGVLHRDIKPGNLMLDDSNKLWITDFGLAQLSNGNELTTTGDVLGTAAYMSPEQYWGSSRVDARSDVYSLGATLFNLLTLQRISEPAPETSSQQGKGSLIERIHASLSGNRLPSDLAWILSKATSHRPDDRYETAIEFGNDLQAYVSGESIPSRPNQVLPRRWALAGLVGIPAASLAAVSPLRTLIPRSPAPWQSFGRDDGPFYARSLKWKGESSLTLETWIRAEQVQAAMLLSVSGVIDLRVEPSETGLLACTQITVGDEHFVQGRSLQTIHPNEAAHLAVCYDHEQHLVSLFLNGKRARCAWSELIWQPDVVSDEDAYTIIELPSVPTAIPKSIWPSLGLSIGSLVTDERWASGYAFRGSMRGETITRDVVYTSDFTPNAVIKLRDETLASFERTSDPTVLRDVSGNELHAQSVINGPPVEWL